MCDLCVRESVFDGTPLGVRYYTFFNIKSSKESCASVWHSDWTATSSMSIDFAMSNEGVQDLYILFIKI